MKKGLDSNKCIEESEWRRIGQKKTMTTEKRSQDEQ